METAFVLAVLSLLFIAALAYSIFHGKEQKETVEELVKTKISQDENVIRKKPSEVTYLGGHPPFGQPFKDGGMILTDKRILFFKDTKLGVFNISFGDITDISCETQEKLTATRLVLTGLLAFAWKKKTPFLLVGMKNEIGEVSRLGFGFGTLGESGKDKWSAKDWREAISLQRYNFLKGRNVASVTV
jgi:hypothetical protein